MWKCSKCETMNDAEFCAVCGASKSEAVVHPTRHSDSFATSSTGYTAPSKLAGTLVDAGKENILRIVSIFGLSVHFLFLFLPTITFGERLMNTDLDSYSIADYLFTDMYLPLSILMFISLIFLGVCIYFLVNKEKLTRMKTFLSIAANIASFSVLILLLINLNNSNTGLFSSLSTISLSFAGWLYLIVTIVVTTFLTFLLLGITRRKADFAPASYAVPTAHSALSSVCKKCGLALDSDATFCMNCGNPVSTPFNVYSPTLEDNAPPAYSPAVSTKESVPTTGVIKSTLKTRESTLEDVDDSATSSIKNTFKKTEDFE